MELSISGPIYKLDRGGIERVAQAAFSYIKDPKGVAELKFVSATKMRELNKTYRGIDRVTDVLSFNIATEPLVGQLFICYTYTKKQAESVGKTMQAEVSLLLVHGILHLVGYDHASASDEAEMQTIEKLILEGEGINR